MSEQMSFNRCKRWFFCTLLLLRKMYFRRSSWIHPDKKVCQCLHGLIRTCEQPRIPCVLGEIGPHAAPLALSVHCQTDMNRIRSVKEFHENCHFLRIKKIKSVHPDLSSAQKRCVLQLGGKAFHAIGLIGQPSLHACGEIIHDEGELPEFLREPSLRMCIIIGGSTEDIGAQAVTLEFGDGMPQCLGKSALADGACKDR